MDTYDVVVIGGGPGGYVAAIRAAQLGMKTACVERWLSPQGKPALGGTCLNVGCIPSKALLDSSHLYEHITKESAAHGISVAGAQIDVPEMLKRKNKVVATLTQGVAGLFKKNGVTWLKGSGSLAGDGKVHVAGPDGEQETVSASHIVIATGSVPATLPFAPVDNRLVCDSTGALEFEAVPKRLGIIGAGVIGLELGSVWRRLGAEVVVLEAAEAFLPLVDEAVAKEALKTFQKQGLDIRLGAGVSDVRAGDGSVDVTYSWQGETHSESFERLVVAVGRRPNTDGLGAEAVGLALDDRGFVTVDEGFRTNLPGVYAVGDVVGGAMLAHKASEEGVALAEMLAGQKPVVDHDIIPWVIYTWPEIAWVGHSEQDLKAAGRNYRLGSFPFMASGRARAMDETGGLVKVLADADTDELLGVHILGPNASELISEAVVTMAFEGAAEDLARTIHAHPTLAEAVHEAALGVDGRTIHI